MKKLFLIAAVALGLGASMTSCNGSCDANNVTPEDSLSFFLGEMYGYGVAGEMQNSPDSAEFSKTEFLKGLQTMMKVDPSKSSYLQGLQMGVQIQSMLKQIKERENVEVDAKKWLAAFKKAFKEDSLRDPGQYQFEVMRLMKECSARAKANNPKAIQNKKQQEAKIAELEKDAEIKKSEGGVYYKVIAEGNGEKFSKTDRIDVKYEGKHLDGEVFDNGNGQAIPMSATGVIKGMGEMFQLMSPGAKYTLYIPAELAYGVEGSGPIGPNEMLVFEVETVGLHVAEKK